MGNCLTHGLGGRSHLGEMVRGSPARVNLSQLEMFRTFTQSGIPSGAGSSSQPVVLSTTDIRNCSTAGSSADEPERSSARSHETYATA